MCFIFTNQRNKVKEKLFVFTFTLRFSDTKTEKTFLFLHIIFAFTSSMFKNLALDTFQLFSLDERALITKVPIPFTLMPLQGFLSIYFCCLRPGRMSVKSI